MKLTHSIIRIWKARGQIVEGIRNSIFKKEDVEKIAHARMSICRRNKCGAYDPTGAGCLVAGTQPCCDERQGGCGCSLSVATRSLSKACPKGLWPAELSEEEEDLLNEKLAI